MPLPAGVDALPAAEVKQLVQGEVRTRLAGRVRWERVAAFEVLQDPFRCAWQAQLQRLWPEATAVVPWRGSPRLLRLHQAGDC